MPSGANRIDEFDGLRAIAVLLVVAGHAPLGKPFDGYIGVIIFFVLSGYLITALLVSEYKASKTILLVQFYGRRSLRITPALWTMLALVGVGCVLFSHAPLQWYAFSAAAFYYMNFLRIINPDLQWVLGHTWSLAVEEQFYLLWPPILLAALRYRPSMAKWAALVLAGASTAVHVALVVHQSPAFRLYDGFDVRSSQLFIGCFTALCEIPPRVGALAARLVWIPVIALAGLVALTRWDTAIAVPGAYQFAAISVAWILMAVRNDSAINAVLRIPSAVYVGRISYGLYLWHFPIIVLLYMSGRNTALWGVAGVVMTVVAAALSFELIEQPALRLARRYFAVKRLRDGETSPGQLMISGA